jgi:PEP-CTERM motif
MARLTCTIAILSAGLLWGGAANADYIVNGGFETEDFSGWTVNGSYISVSPNVPYSYSAEAGSYFAMLGTVGGLGTLSQTFADTAGQNLVISYWLASNGQTPNEFKTEFDGTTLFDQVNIPATSYPYAYVHCQFDVTATGHDSLTFFERNDPSYLALDTVSVTPASSVTTPGSPGSSVPEPISIALLAGGLLGFAAVRARTHG